VRPFSLSLPVQLVLADSPCHLCLFGCLFLSWTSVLYSDSSDGPEHCDVLHNSPTPCINLRLLRQATHWIQLPSYMATPILSKDVWLIVLGWLSEILFDDSQFSYKLPGEGLNANFLSVLRVCNEWKVLTLLGFMSASRQLIFLPGHG
jgi:hypothetical protein